MAENKTKKTIESVGKFISALPESLKSDCIKLDALMAKASGSTGKMWGAAIIGYGDFHYKYESGREGDWFLIGFSPRKANITLYLGYNIEEESDLLKKLGKHKLGKGCLYIKQLSDVDEKMLYSVFQKVVKTQKALEKKMNS